MTDDQIKRALNDAITALMRKASKAERKGKGAEANRLYHSAKALRVHYGIKFPAKLRSEERQTRDDIRYMTNKIPVSMPDGSEVWMTHQEAARHAQAQDFAREAERKQAATNSRVDLGNGAYYFDYLHKPIEEAKVDFSKATIAPHLEKGVLTLHATLPPWDRLKSWQQEQIKGVLYSMDYTNPDDTSSYKDQYEEFVRRVKSWKWLENDK